MSWLGERGARTALFSPYTPNYLLPGLDRERYPEADALLASLGFTRRYDAVAMDRSLNDHVVPADVQDLRRRREAEGYRFATPTDDDLPGLVQMAGERFNPDWARGIREAVVQGLPLERVLATWGPDGTLLGWAMCGAYEDVLERFGPFGVVPESRGTGLGKILLHLTLQRMRALGAHSAWFLWTGRETPAGYLYRGADFTVTRTFTILSAPLPPGTSGTPEDPTTGAER
jgi:GNAT superfamily N-acetyltransferase